MLEFEFHFSSSNVLIKYPGGSISDTTVLIHRKCDHKIAFFIKYIIRTSSNKIVTIQNRLFTITNSQAHSEHFVDGQEINLRRSKNYY